jgi:hypothetical protein
MWGENVCWRRKVDRNRKASCLSAVSVLDLNDYLAFLSPGLGLT